MSLKTLEEKQLKVRMLPQVAGRNIRGDGCNAWLQGTKRVIGCMALGLIFHPKATTQPSDLVRQTGQRLGFDTRR